jgi:protein TonB
MVLPITFNHPDYPIYNETPDEPKTNTYRKEPGGAAFVEVQNMPTYPGGITAFYDYVSSNFNYPEEAKKMGLEGKVFVQFKVNTDGSISDVRIMRGIGSGCDEEAKKVVESSPNWNPMIVDGKAQEMTMVMPITFKLE